MTCVMVVAVSPLFARLNENLYFGINARRTRQNWTLSLFTYRMLS